MPKTKKTSTTSAARRGASSKTAKTTGSRGSTAKRKPQTSKSAPRKSAAGIRKPAARAKKQPPRAKSRLKLKIGLTALACLIVVVLAVLGAVYYDKLVPAKSPAVAKNKTSVTVHVPMQSAPQTAEKPAAKAPVTPTKPTEPQAAASAPAKPQAVVTEPAPGPPVAKAATPPPVVAKKPRMALIFDDMGNDTAAAKKLQNLKIPLTFSILPYSAKGREMASGVPAHIEIMVHVPMQANDGSSDTEQGLLRAEMTEAELAQVLRADLDRIPNARGINNHTGSRLTRQLVPMQVVMLVLKERNLFFIDSKTSEKSVAKDAAQMLLVPTAARDYFLDHVADKATIKEQLYLAVNAAKRRGSVIVIGHPRPLTLEVVLEELPKLVKEIEFVPVSALVK